MVFEAGVSGDQEYEIPDCKASELMDELKAHRIGSRHAKELKTEVTDEGTEGDN